MVRTGNTMAALSEKKVLVILNTDTIIRCNAITPMVTANMEISPAKPHIPGLSALVFFSTVKLGIKTVQLFVIGMFVIDMFLLAARHFIRIKR